MKKLSPWLIALLLIYAFATGPSIWAFHYFEFSNTPYCYKLFAVAIYPHLLFAAYSETYYHYLQWWLHLVKPGKTIPHLKFKQVILKHL